jgi:hypothetical protein
MPEITPMLGQFGPLLFIASIAMPTMVSVLLKHFDKDLVLRNSKRGNRSCQGLGEIIPNDVPMNLQGRELLGVLIILFLSTFLLLYLEFQ